MIITDIDSLVLDTLLGGLQCAVLMNTQTCEVTVVKPGLLLLNKGQIIPGKVLFQSLLELPAIHGDDLYKFHRFNDISRIRQICESRRDGLLFFCRLKENDCFHWERLFLFISESYSETYPYVMLCSQCLSDMENSQIDICLNIDYYTVKYLRVDLAADYVKELHQLHSDRLSAYSGRNFCYSERVKLIAQELVHPDDREQFIKYVNNDFLRKHFASGEKIFVMYYRRLDKSLYRWVSIRITKSAEYSMDNPVVTIMVFDENDLMVHHLNSLTELGITSPKDLNRGDPQSSYYENVMLALYSFTASFESFFVADIEHDSFISFRSRDYAVENSLPRVTSFSAALNKWLSSRYSGAEKERVLEFASADRLRKVLRHQATTEEVFERSDGRHCRFSFTKTESDRDNVIKVIGCSVLEPEKNILKIQTFGNFEAFDSNGQAIRFEKTRAKEILAYLVDKAGYPVSSADLIADILERDVKDVNAQKYISSLIHIAVKALETAGFVDVVRKDRHSVRIVPEKIDCDYYHLINGENRYWREYHNEYMKEYSWAEETNAELLHFFN